MLTLALPLILIDCSMKDSNQAALENLRVRRATGPLRVDTANMRYFTDQNGAPVYLTGSHTWANLQDIYLSHAAAPFDYSGYLAYLEQYNHNFFRLWSWEQAKWATAVNDDVWFEPLPYERTGPGLALDNRPKFDLARLNQAYFDRLRKRVIAARERGIYVSIMLFNGFSIETKNSQKGNPWLGHPFNRSNNINGIDGDPNGDGEGKETHTLQVPAIRELQEAYVRKVIDTVNDLDNVLFEISNESHEDSQDWQYHMISYIKSYEATKPNKHPVGMTVEYPDGDNTKLFASPADWISPNGVDGYKTSPPSATGSKVIIIDTDHLWGIGGDGAWVWKSFLRGLNPILMDPYDGALGMPADYRIDDPRWVSLRRNMGYTLTYANRINLAAMTPHGELVSTEYCLANPVATGAEYLVYLPSGGTVSVNLSAAKGILSLEWFIPATGKTIIGGQTIGGSTESFTAPIVKGDAVLYIHHFKEARDARRMREITSGRDAEDTSTSTSSNGAQPS